MEDVKMAVCDRYPVSLINRVGGVLISTEDIVERTKKIIDEKKAVSYTHLDVYKRQVLKIRRQ